MSLWIVILVFIIVVTLLALYGTALSTARLFQPDCGVRSRCFRLCFLGVLAVFVIISVLLKVINAVVIFMHLAFFLLLASILSRLSRKLLCHQIPRAAGFTVAVILAAAVLSCGWYLDHSVVRTDYTVTVPGNAPELKILLFADVHLGSTFDHDGFADHLKSMEQVKPDLVVLAGDFVDDSSTKEGMVAACAALGRFPSRYGTFYVDGNHDKGYYGTVRGFSLAELTRELTDNGIHVLRDDTVTLGESYYLTGRKDLSEEKELHRGRKSPAELAADLAPGRVRLAIDHQPAGQAQLAAAGFDLVMSGHTHGGQIFPFGYLGLLSGAIDQVYGHKIIDGTSFIVTSGISDWAIRFKTGTRSEYVVITVRGDGTGTGTSPAVSADTAGKAPAGASEQSSGGGV